MRPFQTMHSKLSSTSTSGTVSTGIHSVVICFMARYASRPDFEFRGEPHFDLLSVQREARSRWDAYELSTTCFIARAVKIVDRVGSAGKCNPLSIHSYTYYKVGKVGRFHC